jgi:hypothetical protein
LHRFRTEAWERCEALIGNIVALLIETRGSKEGICNICGIYGPLTEDHTPPKGCKKPRAVEIHEISVNLKAELPTSRGRISENGVKYRTLCKSCNNTLLGAEYDPSFVNFVNELAMYLKTQIQMPPAITLKIKPQRVMRSLLGHIAAQGINRYEKGEITESFRNYLINPSQNLPDSLNIYCWPFPYQKHVMARDCVMGYLTDKPMEPISIWFLKFFPVAFMVTINEPESCKFKLERLSNYRDLKIDDEIEITMDLKTIIHPYWPDVPNNNFMLMYGKEAITSFNKRKKQTK